jgi:hypothetical protein
MESSNKQGEMEVKEESKVVAIEPKEQVDIITYKSEDDSRLGLSMKYSKEGEEDIVISSEIKLTALMGLADLIYRLHGSLNPKNDDSKPVS